MSHLRVLSILLVLLGLAALANARDENDLIKAAGKGDVQRVRELIDAKADVNVKDKNGLTPLTNAAIHGYTDIVTLLLDKGADIEAGNKFGDTALTSAAAAHRTEVVKLLLDRGANTEAMDRIFRHTALMEAAINGYADIATLLLDKGANLEAKGSLVVVGEQGMPRLIDLKADTTALILAAANGQTDVVKLLLARGANPEPEMDGATSAALMRTTDAVMLLRNAAAARHSGQATSGAQAPSQPPLPSTSHLAGLYQSERLGTEPRTFYDYFRLYCDGRVLNISMGGDGKRDDIAVIVKAFDKGLGGSGTYQIQRTAIEFSIQLPEGTFDYQGQIEGTSLSLDWLSHVNGHRGHTTYHLVQPGDCAP